MRGGEGMGIITEESMAGLKNDEYAHTDCRYGASGRCALKRSRKTRCKDYRPASKKYIDAEFSRSNDDEIIVHSALIYECAKCGKQWHMWLECGVGGSDGIMPCPFMIVCHCGGTAKHIDWHKDIHLPHPRLVSLNESNLSYFKLDREGLKNKVPQACGIPVVNPESFDLRTPRP